MKKITKILIGGAVIVLLGTGLTLGHVYRHEIKEGISNIVGNTNKPAKPIEPDAPLTCKVTINIFDETLSMNVINGEEIELPETPQVIGYEFRGWLLNDEYVEGNTIIVTSNITITADFVKIHNIQFKVDDKTVLSESIKNGETIKYNDNLLLNSSFKQNDQGQSTYPAGQANEIETVNNWNIISVTENINEDGSLTFTDFKNFGRFWQNISNIENLKGKTVTLSVKFKEVSYTTGGDPRILINDGLTNTLSSTIENGFNGIVSVTKTLDLEATTLNVRAVHNHLSPAESDSSVTIEWVKLEIGNEATEYIDNTKEGFTFKGWAVDGVLVDIEDYVPTKDTIFEAVFEEITELEA